MILRFSDPETHHDFEVSLNWRHIGRLKSEFTSGNPNLSNPGNVYPIDSHIFLWPASSSGEHADLLRAYRVIASKQYVDLTHSFGPDTPVWSGFGQAKMTAAVDPKTHEPYTIAKDGFRATFYEMVGQYGTHVDPPAHFDQKGITLDEIPLKQMILPLVVLDNTPYQAKDESHAFSVADLQRWERRGTVAFRAAHSSRYTDMYKDWDSNPERFSVRHSCLGV
jgi:hypothetical protein